MAKVTKQSLAIHCANLTALWFELGGSFDNDDNALFQMAYEQTGLSDKADTKAYHRGEFAMGSVRFFMHGSKVELMVFIVGMQKDINKRLKTKINRRVIRG